MKAHLLQRGFDVTDAGMTDKNEPLPYHIVGYRVGQAVSTGRFERGIAICGSGMGIHIAAGKFPNVYCALCETVATARRSRVANGCNILSFGAFYTKLLFWQMTLDNKQATFATINAEEAYVPEEIKARSICLAEDIKAVRESLL